MSHVHGPHDHAVEHAAHSGDKLAQWVAVFTAILAAISGLCHYEESVLQTRSLLYKNEAVLLQSKESDTWNYYQAKAQKQNLSALAAELTNGKKADFYKSEVARYENQKKDIRTKAEAMQKDVEHANQMSEHLEEPQHMFGRALALINVAISLAAITSLTGNRKLFLLAQLAGAIGIGLSVFAWLSI